MTKPRNPFKSLCKVTKDNNTIPPEFAVCRVMKYIRLIKNMTQQGIAEVKTPDGKFMSQSYISKIELMQITPTFDTVFLFCQLTKTDPCDFLDCVAKTMYMSNLQAAEYIGKKIMKILMDE